MHTLLTNPIFFQSIQLTSNITIYIYHTLHAHVYISLALLSARIGPTGRGVAPDHVALQLRRRGEDGHLAHLLAKFAAVVRLAEVLMQVLWCFDTMEGQTHHVIEGGMAGHSNNDVLSCHVMLHTAQCKDG